MRVRLAFETSLPSVGRLVKPLRPLGSLGMFALCALTLAKGALAGVDAEVIRRGTVAVHVGARTITVGEIEDRMAQIPAFQLKSFGDTPETQRKKFTEDVLVPEVLYALSAESRKVDQWPAVRRDLARARSEATLRGVRAKVGPAASVTDEDVQKYYDVHKPQYDAPERYHLWRILCAKKEDCEKVLGDVKVDGTPATWSSISRERSIDKATNLRGGSLGFVDADGNSNEPGLKVDSAIVKAAMAVRDGDIVPQVIQEGSNFAVIWRRGTVGASHRSAQEVKDQIQSAIVRQRVEDEVGKLVTDLRKSQLKEHSPELLDGVDIAPPQANVVPRKRPGQVPPRD